MNERKKEKEKRALESIVGFDWNRNFWWVATGVALRGVAAMKGTGYERETGGCSFQVKNGASIS